MSHKQLTLVQVCDKFLKGLTGRLTNSGRPIAEGTVAQYVTTVDIIRQFVDSHPKMTRKACNVDRKFYNGFVGWLNSRGMAANTIGKHIKNLKAILRAELPARDAARCEFLQRGSCVRLGEQIDNVYLNESELRQIRLLELDGTSAAVRDTFVLLCYTGCRYSDLVNFVPGNIVGLANGRALVFIQRKTNREVVVPLLPEAEEILANNGGEIPPQVTLQTFNSIIKSVCRKAGIVDRTVIHRTQGGSKVARVREKCEFVSAHTARRSFATNLYKRGLPTSMIMSATGHETERAFRTYIKITRYENAEMLLSALNG